ncbi:MAG: IPExxxVDY family protein [bacterium]
MAKRLLLEFHSASPTYTFVGLSTQLKDYRLSFMLNQKLGFHLARIDDLSVFSLYTFRDEERFDTYYVLSNHSQDQWLLPALKQTDFFLIIEGPFKKQQKEELLRSIRAIPNILLAAEIDISAVRLVENLLSDLELHMIKIHKSTHFKTV